MQKLKETTSGVLCKKFPLHFASGLTNGKASTAPKGVLGLENMQFISISFFPVDGNALLRRDLECAGALGLVMQGQDVICHCL